ncbi:hypothetical protein [Sulfuricaulis limicola]|uniref:hypothetical protein n=1 Tax=Sulfuricaulis limicola TaxID=1620215 RepID=UPI0011E4CBD5|nr:hypothetical protein [Sulfuricaulis limicola]
MKASRHALAVRDSRRKAAHITKDAHELQGKIINPASGGREPPEADTPENGQKKGVAGEPRPNHH